MNGFEKAIETVGHDVKVLFVHGEKLVANLPKYIKAAEDAGQDAKKVVPLVQNVVAAAVAFAKPAAAIGAALSQSGVNLAADAAALSAVVTEGKAMAGDITTFVAAVKALCVEIGVDWHQLTADLEGATV